MNSVLNSFAFLTVFSFSVYIILRIVSRSFSAVFKSEKKSDQNFSNGGVDSQELRRDMGFYECYLAETSRKCGTKIYAILSLKSAVNLRRENINNTLRLLARKYPILRARITSYQNARAYKTEFIINAEDRFVPELRFINTSHWKMILEEALVGSSERSDDQLLWNTIVLREQYEAREKIYINTLLFLFDPVIVDRISVVKFTEDFIAILCQLVNCDIHVNNTKTVRLEAPPEEFLRLPFPVLLFSRIKQVLLTLLRLNCGPVSSHQKERRCRVRTKPLVVTKSISEKDTSRLFKYCNNLNCSLTALFITAWSEIVSCHAGSAKALCRRKPVTVVVDYRTSLTTVQPQSYLSNGSSWFQLQLCNQDKKSRHFESAARYCENLLNSAVKRRKHLDLIWKLKYHNHSFNTKECAESSPLEISDVGRFNFKPTWPFSLHEIFIGASNTSTVNLTLLVVNQKLYCGMHLSSHFSGCADLLNALFARVVQNMSLNILKNYNV